MKIKTSELIGAALDWAVGTAEGYDLSLYGVDPSIRARVPGQGVHAPWRPAYYWNQGGPIIEQERIHWGMTAVPHGAPPTTYLAYQYQRGVRPVKGPTPLIAAMRCYVASKLGDEVEIPEELAT